MKLQYLSNYIVNLQATNVANELSNGYIRIYSGPQPANADTPLDPSSVLLCELRFAVDAFSPPLNGVITSNPIEDAPTLAAGTASFARYFKADGTTVVLDGNVGLSDASVIVSTTNFQLGLFVNVLSITYEVLKEYTGV